MALHKHEIAAPVLPMEAVPVPELGGEVIVRGLLLRDRLELAINDPGNAYGRIARMLALSVVDSEQAPIWSADEWEVFGAAHFAAALKLFEVAQRLSGLQAEESLSRMRILPCFPLLTPLRRFGSSLMNTSECMVTS